MKVLKPALFVALLLLSAIFATSAHAQGKVCSVMSAALTSNEANTNAGSCGVGCSIISQTLVYHVTCKLQPGTTTTLSVDASAIATAGQFSWMRNASAYCWLAAWRLPASNKTKPRLQRYKNSCGRRSTALR